LLQDTSGNNSQKLIEISNNLQGLNFHLVETVGSIRKFLKEGNMKKLTSKGKKMTVHFYLFNDLLIYAKPANIGKNYIFRAKYPLLGATATVLNDSERKLYAKIIVKNIVLGLSHSFQVEVSDGHKKRKFLLNTTSLEDREAWLAAFMEAIESQRIRNFAEKENFRRTKSFHATAGPLEDSDDEIEEIQITPKIHEPKKRADSTPMSHSATDVSELARPMLARRMMMSEDNVERHAWRHSVKPSAVVIQNVNKEDN
jgi:hypothetical protein